MANANLTIPVQVCCAVEAEAAMRKMSHALATKQYECEILHRDKDVVAAHVARLEAALREIQLARGLWADDAAEFQRNRIDSMVEIARLALTPPPEAEKRGEG